MILSNRAKRLLDKKDSQASVQKSKRGTNKIRTKIKRFLINTNL